MVKVKDIKVGDVILVKMPHWSDHVINEAKVLDIKDTAIKLEMETEYTVWARKRDLKIYEVICLK